MSFPQRTAKLKQFAALPKSGERSPPMHAWQETTVIRKNSIDA